jgi:Dna[CI] antecedent, DciA
MRGTGPTPLGALLDIGKLRELGDEARQRRRLTEQVRALLPAEEAAHVLTASRAADGGLVLGMDSAAWASRVRYRQPEIDGRPVTVRVVPPGGSGDEPTKNPPAKNPPTKNQSTKLGDS